MSMSNHINNILKSKEEVFFDIVDKIVLANFKETQKELEREYIFNKVLYESVEFTIERLNQEEGIISKILYKSFGIGAEKNERRQQLLGLGGKLKKEINLLGRERKRISFNYENISSSFISLERLAEALGRKRPHVRSRKIEKKCNFYFKELYKKMDEIDSLKKELEMKSIYLESCIFKYKKLLERIPRYREIENPYQLGYSS